MQILNLITVLEENTGKSVDIPPKKTLHDKNNDNKIQSR